MFSEDGVSEDGVHRNVQQELGWGSTRLKLGCSRKVKAEGTATLGKCSFPGSIAKGSPVRSHWGPAPAEMGHRFGKLGWGFRLQLSIPFNFRESSEDKMLCFSSPGQKKRQQMFRGKMERQFWPCRIPWYQAGFTRQEEVPGAHWVG